MSHSVPTMQRENTDASPAVAVLRCFFLFLSRTTPPRPHLGGTFTLVAVTTVHIIHSVVWSARQIAWLCHRIIRKRRQDVNNQTSRSDPQRQRKQGAPADTGWPPACGQARAGLDHPAQGLEAGCCAQAWQASARPGKEVIVCDWFIHCLFPPFSPSVLFDTQDIYRSTACPTLFVSPCRIRFLRCCPLLCLLKPAPSTKMFWSLPVIPVMLLAVWA